MSKNKWNSFIKELSNDIFFMIFGVVFFQIFRLSFIGIYSNEIGEYGTFDQLLKTISMGFRFDITVVSYFVLLPFVSNLILALFNGFKYIKRVRKFFQILFIVLSTIIYIVTINYYREYNDQFNHFLFVGLYDDKKAVFETIIKDFNIFLNLFSGLAIIVLSFFTFRFFENREGISNFLLKFKKIYSRTLLVLLTISLFVFSIRGSIGKRPAMRKWSYVSKDNFYNKTVMNPFRSLVYAIKDFKSINKKHGSNPYGKFKTDCKTIAQFTEKFAKGSKFYEDTEKPNQIFLVVMESYDSWPLMDEYSCFGVSNCLKDIQNRGIRYNHFLPSATSTMNSLSSIITGIPYTGINISKIGALNGGYLSSMLTQFKSLGYETNFFYGGFLSWQNVGNLFKAQGTDNVYSAPDAGGKSDRGTWGIEDEKLFNLVLNKVDKSKKSLNIIMTTSYHPPYSIDVYKKGFPYRSEKELPKKAQSLLKGGKVNIKTLGHLWYSDKCIGDFVKSAESKYEKSLFLFTGDHYGRKFITPNPNLYEKSSVPFILYGKGITPKLDTTPSSHIDISPTLIEMIAPKDFKYYSFGKSIGDKEGSDMGFGKDRIITKNEILSIDNGNRISKFDLNSKKRTEIKNSSYLKDYNKLFSLAWHYIVKGDSLDLENGSEIILDED
ncbi:MAG: alkaline phosphatase [Candidatus Cloacimonadota bacterium]|nr:MAG: alkaline phosphatase [Candidatus Cloacimonadota bacterium]PIE81089.1 MAG: alkaline phosphatase [Candidatus Delongbacteria bacterium]